MAAPDHQRPPSPPAVQDLTGKTVGRFIIRGRLGAGGMGEVYLAEDTKLKRVVALKRMAPQLHSDERFRRRFLSEAERASSLTDPHVAGIYDVFEEGGEIFLVMEYIEGSTLRGRLAEPIDIQEFLAIAAQCAEALVTAHEKGIVHQDIKPENIMLTPKGQVKICDFGVARRLPALDQNSPTESEAGQTDALRGTPTYMAPEVLLEKEVDGRADIFSLGMVFYEILTGRHPFVTRGFVATSDRILHVEPTPLTNLNPRAPAELERIVAKMLAKDPAQRYATAADLLVDLRAVGRGLALPGLPAAPARPLPGLSRKLWKVMAALALLLVALAGVPLLRLALERRAAPGPLPSDKTVVVTPFLAVGGSAGDQVYSDGLTETLTAKLTQLTGAHALQVVPAAEVRARRVTSAEEARRELGATLVLEGSLFRSGEMARVNYALVDARTRVQLRAGTVTAPASNTFALQDRVVEGVAAMLDLALKPAERETLVAHGTQVAAAYDLYLQGRGYLQNYHKPENIQSAVRVFQRAAELDPRYALAYAGLGEAYWQEYRQSRESKWVAEARTACQKAVELEAARADGHTCLGDVYNEAGGYEQAVAEFQLALQLEPTNDHAYRGLASAYHRLNKLVEAEETYRRAIELRPQYWAGYNWLGDFYNRTGNFLKAAKMFERVVELAPDNQRGYANLGAMYYLLGRWPEAEQAYKKSLALRESATAYSNLGTLHFFQSRYAEAARMFEKAVQLEAKREKYWGNLADAYRWAPGEADKAPPAYAKAMALAEEELRMDPRRVERISNLALYRAKTGQKAEALRAIEKATALAPSNVAVLYSAAVVYHLAGDRTRALSWLKKAVEGRYPVREIQADPELRDLRNDPVFQKLVGNP